jgi:hypothetical protein
MAFLCRSGWKQATLTDDGLHWKSRRNPDCGTRGGITTTRTGIRKQQNMLFAGHRGKQRRKFVVERRIGDWSLMDRACVRGRFCSRAAR